MVHTLKLVGLLAAGLTLAACETTDVNRAAIGGVGGALAAEALGGDRGPRRRPRRRPAASSATTSRRASARTDTGRPSAGP